MTPLPIDPAVQTAVTELAEAAGRAIMAVYDAGDAQARSKADASPLTLADERAHALIAAQLATLTPNIPVVSEEDGAVAPRPPLPATCWVVDPLDGTKEFLKRTGEFTVNIALVIDDRPVFGVVHAPALATTWVGAPRGAVRRTATGETPIAVRAPRSSLAVVASRDHAGPMVSQLLAAHPTFETVSVGSSLKFCRVAEGAADLYLRDGPTMVWDTAAGQAVLEAAGGCVLQLDGAPLSGAVPELRNPFFVAIGSPALPWQSFLLPVPTSPAVHHEA